MQEQNGKVTFSDLDIEKCFKNFYLIPDYQREYVWEEKHVAQLLTDIHEQFSVDPKSDYFIGTTVVCKTDDGVLELIDGQQRTSTLFVILCAFRTIYVERKLDIDVINHMIKDKSVDQRGESTERFRLELQYAETDNVLELISRDETRPKSLHNSGTRLYDAYDFAKRFLNESFMGSDAAELKSFFGYLYRKLHFIQIESPGVNKALKVFETINARGIGLNPMDLLKNLLFRNIESTEFSLLKAEWQKVMSLLETHNEKPLRFLRYFIMANYNVKNGKNEETVREDEIYEWIMKPENQKQTKYSEKPFDFVRLLLQNAELFVKFFEGADSAGPNVYLDNLRKLGGGAFKQHLILLLSARHLEKALFDHLAKTLEALMFYYFITGEQAKNFERNFAKWAKLLLKVKNKAELNTFIETTLRSEVLNRENLFRSNFENLGLNSLQKYRTRYILAKIAQYCDQERLGSYTPQNLTRYITAGVEIEHILPENPEADLRAKYGTEYDGLKLMLGNLTLLEKSINASIGRGDFYNVKKAEYAKSEFYLTKSIAKLENVGSNTAINRLNERLKQFEVWNEESISLRQEMMYELGKQIWKVEAMK